MGSKPADMAQSPHFTEFKVRFDIYQRTSCRFSSSNKLKVVGPELGRLVNLNRLFLGANRIVALDGIQPLENLTVLSLQYATHTAHRAAQTILS